MVREADPFGVIRQKEKKKNHVIHLAFPGVLQRACVWAPSHTPQMCGCLESPCGRCSRTVRSPGSVCQADRYALVSLHVTVRNRAPLCLRSQWECDSTQRPFDIMLSAVCSHHQILWRVEREGERLEKPPDCPQELYAVMRKCWMCNPNDRPNFTQLGTLVAEVG